MIRRHLEAHLRRWWGGEGGVAGVVFRGAARPLSFLYAGGVAVRNRGFDSGRLTSVRGEIPVVSVGNLSVGGTGKTPTVRWVVEALRQGGEHPAVVSRGYAEDEPALHRRWNPDVPVITDPLRARGVREAAAQGATVAVLDDAFQHRALRRDLDLVLLAAEDPRPPRLLPAGPYRESFRALARADRVLITRKVADDAAVASVERDIQLLFPALPQARVHFVPGPWRSVTGGDAPPPQGPLVAVSGVASPTLFAGLLRGITGEEVDLMAFPDHHDFRADDLAAVARRAAGRAVVITEKDAVKFAALPPLLPDVTVMTLAMEFESGEADLRAALLDTVRGARRGGA